MKNRLKCHDCGKDCAATGVFAYKGMGYPATHRCPHGRPCHGPKGIVPKERCSECKAAAKGEDPSMPKQVSDDALNEATARVLEGALEAISKDRVIAATDALVEHLDGLFLAGEIEMARRLLARLDPERLPPKVLSGVLMIIKAAKAALGEEPVDRYAEALALLFANLERSKATKI